MTEKILPPRKFLPVCVLFLFLLFRQDAVEAEAQLLVPVGQTVGVTLNMKGVAVVDTADVEGYDNKRCAPAKEAGIQPGDVIVAINGSAVESAQQLEETVNQQGQSPLLLTIQRKGKERACQAEAVQSKADGRYRLGVWIKDAASGIGTITYVDPDTGEFGALGHAITQEPGQEEPMPIQDGSVLKATVVSVQKGSKGCPGELMGVFAEDRERLGTVQANTESGLRGVLDGEAKLTTAMEPIPVAERNQVREGPAQILANIEGSRVETFAVEIEKINQDTKSAKGMVIKVTDPSLLARTGGVVQGMSGSPIIQDGKLVGAVTHVFVNDPTQGYGIFIEQMQG